MPSLRSKSKKDRTLPARPSKKAKLTHKKAEYSELARLNLLPVEIVECICGYLPNRDSLLYLRATCRHLCEKTSTCFGKAYWTRLFFVLTSTQARCFTLISYRRNLTAFIKDISLCASQSRLSYDNYLLAKGLDAENMATALGRLTQLTSLTLRAWSFGGCREFFTDFARYFWVRKLQYLWLDGVKIDDVDVAHVIKKHRATLNHVHFENVNLYGELNPEDKYLGMDEYYLTPWSTVFEALLDIQNNTHVQVDKPMQFGREVDLEPNSYDFDFSDRPYCFMGLTIDVEPNDDVFDYEMIERDDMHVVAEVDGDEHWKHGVRQLDAIYSYFISDPDHDGTPPWFHIEVEEVLLKKGRTMDDIYNQRCDNDGELYFGPVKENGL